MLFRSIVDVTGDQPVILRPGGISREELEQALGHAVPMVATSAVRVPGQHPLHYAPRARVILVEPGEVLRAAQRQQAQGSRVGVLLPPALEHAAGAGQVVLLVPESMAEYARQIY